MRRRLRKTDQPGTLISTDPSETRHGTHKYQGRVQIFIVLLEELLVVFLGHLLIVLIKLSLVNILSEKDVLSLAARVSKRDFWSRTKEIYRSAWCRAVRFSPPSPSRLPPGPWLELRADVRVSMDGNV